QCPPSTISPYTTKAPNARPTLVTVSSKRCVSTCIAITGPTRRARGAAPTSRTIRASPTTPPKSGTSFHRETKDDVWAGAGDMNDARARVAIGSSGWACAIWAGGPGLGAGAAIGGAASRCRAGRWCFAPRLCVLAGAAWTGVTVAAGVDTGAGGETGAAGGEAWLVGATLTGAGGGGEGLGAGFRTTGGGGG